MIEELLERVATALEALVAHNIEQSNTTAAAPVAAAPVVAAANTAPVLLSDEDMNNALVAEFKRFGNREVIDAEMAKLGVTSVVGMTAENQNALLTAVRAFDA